MKFLSLALLGCAMFCTTFSTQTSLNAEETTTAAVPSNTVRIVIEKEGEDTFKAYNYDSKGKKEPLTLGTFFRASAEVMLGKKIADCKKGEPLKLLYDKDSNGNTMTFLVDSQGVKKRFLFKDLIVALPGTLQCGETKTPAPVSTAKPNPNEVLIFFDKDSSGNLQTYIVHTDGRKELLEFADLFTSTAELLKDCPLGTEKDRAVYIVFEKNSTINPQTRSADKYPPNALQTVQIDAYGQKEELNLDNIVHAAAETLQVCASKKGMTLAAPPASPFLKIQFEKDSSNHLQAFLVDSKGKRGDLTLGTLMTAAAGISPCKYAPKTHFIDVVFEKDSTGGLKPVVVDSQGEKKDFNLIGNLLTTALTLCANQGKK